MYTFNSTTEAKRQQRLRSGQWHHAHPEPQSEAEARRLEPQSFPKAETWKPSAKTYGNPGDHSLP